MFFLLNMTNLYRHTNTNLINTKIRITSDKPNNFIIIIEQLLWNKRSASNVDRNANLKF